MHLATRVAVLAAGLLAFRGAAAQVVDFSGTWTLDVHKSKWGTVKQPIMVLIEIQHVEPRISYTGSVTYTDEESRDFGFRGALDGKPYPVTRSYGSGEMVLHRIDGQSVTSEFKTGDGRYIETVVISVSRDRRTLTRKIRVKSPAGDASWTETYNRTG